MAITTTIKYDSLPEFIKSSIDKEVKAFAEKEFEIAKKQAIEKIDKYKDQVVAGVILHVQRQMTMDTCGQELRIAIINKDQPNPNKGEELIN